VGEQRRVKTDCENEKGRAKQKQLTVMRMKVVSDCAFSAVILSEAKDLCKQ